MSTNITGSITLNNYNKQFIYHGSNTSPVSEIIEVFLSKSLTTDSSDWATFQSIKNTYSKQSNFIDHSK